MKPKNEILLTVDVTQDMIQAVESAAAWGNGLGIAFLALFMAISLIATVLIYARTR